MKYLKFFNDDDSLESKKYIEEVASICRFYNIKNWSLDSNGNVNANDVNLNYREFDSKSLPLKFGRVNGNFACGGNTLTSLEGCPSYIGGSLWCIDSYIKSFKGIVYIGGKFYCYNNPIYALWKLFKDVSLIDQFNEWEIIQGNNVYLYRLNDFLETIGKPEVNEFQLNEIKKYYNVI